MEKLYDDIHHYKRTEALVELRRKLASGVAGHIAICAILISFTPLANDHLLPSLLLFGLIILSSIARLPLTMVTLDTLRLNPRAWKRKVYIALYLTLFGWAGVFAYALSHYPVESVTAILICLVAAGNTSNATSALSSDPILARVFAVVSMGSIAVPYYLMGNSEAFAVSLLCLAHLTYNLLQINIFRKSFGESKEREYRLKILEKELTQSSLLMSGILDGLEDAVSLRDLDGNVQMINRSGEKMSEQFKGQTLNYIVAGTGDSVIEEKLRSINSRGLEHKGGVREIISASSGDAPHIHFARSTFPYRNSRGEVIGTLSVMRDITATIQNEETLIQARAAAEAAARSKADFLASMSHEIRTPLNGILGMTEILIESDLTPDQERLARIVQSSGHGLLTIINDILDFSKIEAGKMEFEATPFDLPQVLESQIELLRPKAREKDIELSFDLSALKSTRFYGDAGRISQVILNLLSNAIKFTECGFVRLSVEATSVEDDTDSQLLRWNVTDSGIGMSAETLGILFTPFTQADGSTARRYGGTGLGLSISKRLVDLMGGCIGVHSQQGRGSTFWFELKLKLCHECPQQILSRVKDSKNERGIEGHRILIVEDNEVNQKLTMLQLEKFGLRYQIAGNGRIALDILQTEVFDLILMDCQMPEMDGFEATSKIRMLPFGNRIPIIAMTANALKQDQDRCLAVGMDDFIAKPIKKDKLEAKLRLWLSANQSIRKRS